jgi:hypothetical protein
MIECTEGCAECDERLNRRDARFYVPRRARLRTRAPLVVSTYALRALSLEPAANLEDVELFADVLHRPGGAGSAATEGVFAFAEGGGKLPFPSVGECMASKHTNKELGHFARGFNSRARIRDEGSRIAESGRRRVAKGRVLRPERGVKEGAVFAL